MSPSAVVTEGQRVTLTCSTSCPLTDNTNYIWYLNSRPLTPRENQNKHLILDPVSREDAGSYSCAVKSNKDISSAPKTLTVQSITGTWTPSAAGVSAALLVLILLSVCWCVRRKRNSHQPSRNENLDDLEYDDIAAHQGEQDLNYQRLHVYKNETDSLYSTIPPSQPREQHHIHYTPESKRTSRQSPRRTSDNKEQVQNWIQTKTSPHLSCLSSPEKSLQLFQFSHKLYLMIFFLIEFLFDYIQLHHEHHVTGTHYYYILRYYKCHTSTIIRLISGLHIIFGH
ncbi:uncharacterized protein LOC102314278 isoform X1 [Haplochromis burtoni]|uniref:uncharacterized protein LOC102314278 isoform X1 n=1 Tax=Haplochromis burtoni TaxID=8153 RepID=UPI001C2D9EB6|nr:uncharacterized protein LOC102314278 isoform X1 [Haplochromis burtoni]